MYLLMATVQNWEIPRDCRSDRPRRIESLYIIVGEGRSTSDGAARPT